MDFCDLSWDEKGLSFQEMEMEVMTASSSQVKQPLYKSSIGAWKKDEKYLRSLKSTIEGIVQ